MASLDEVRNELIHGHVRGFVTDDELHRGTSVSKRAIGAANGMIRYLMNNPDVPE